MRIMCAGVRPLWCVVSVVWLFKLDYQQVDLYICTESLCNSLRGANCVALFVSDECSCRTCLFVVVDVARAVVIDDVLLVPTHPVRVRAAFDQSDTNNAMGIRINKSRCHETTQQPNNQSAV